MQQGTRLGHISGLSASRKELAFHRTGNTKLKNEKIAKRKNKGLRRLKRRSWGATGWMAVGGFVRRVCQEF